MLWGFDASTRATPPHTTSGTDHTVVVTIDLPSAQTSAMASQNPSAIVGNITTSAIMI